jgi:predicted ATPase/DNA-binding CsgD family transcriptional regulator
MRTPGLTPREQDTLQAVARRLTNAEIAAEFHLSVRTVESHIASLRRKLLAESRRELIEAAARYVGRPVSVPMDSFVGRDDVLVRAQGLLAESRWLTVTGPAGVGKTRLALELAHRAPSVVVELEHVEPGGVLGAVAAALGLDPATAPGVVTACCSALSGGAVQLVLDNADRVAADAASVIRRLLGQLATLRVISTSRTPLRGPGESVLELLPLAADSPGDPGVRLFLDRARTAAAPIDLGDIATVLDVCQRLDGIPLAIELAAARTRHVSLAELDRLLADGFAALGITASPPAPGSSGPGERHAALATAFAWSWDLLDDGLRAILCRLAALPRSFDLDLAAVATGERVDAQVFELVDRSLLVKVGEPGGTTRFRVLAALREFINAHTDLMVLDEVARRHAEHHRTLATTLAARARTDDRATTRALAKAVCPEVNDALRWAIDHDHPVASELAVAVAVGVEQYGPGPGMMQALIDVVDDPRVRATWSAPELEVIGRALSYLRVDLVEELAGRARDLAAAGADVDRLAAAKLTGAALVYRGDACGALPYLDEAIDLATSLGNQWERADALQLRAMALARTGALPPDELIAALEVARTAYVAAGDSMHVNNTRYMMALAAGEDEALRPRAVAWADECLAYATRAGNETEVAHARLARALAGGTDHAEDVTEAARLFRRVGDLRCLSRALVEGAALDPDRAEPLLREALEAGAACGDAARHARAAGALATWLWERGRRAEASAVLGAATAVIPGGDVDALVPDALAAEVGRLTAH